MFLKELKSYLTAEEAKRRRYLAATVFSPSAPIDRQSLFAGRTKQLETLIDSIGTRGRHVVLFGERGVGKTSLTTVLRDIFNEISQPIQFVKINCDSGDNFDSIWRKVLKDVRLVSRSQSVGFSQEEQVKQISLDSYFPNNITPDDIRSALETVGRHTVVILDEFDRVENNEAKLRMADTIKNLSDNSVNATLIIIGVADNISELISEHHSIDRALTQILMPRMESLEIDELITKAVRQLEMEIDVSALQMITTIAQGLPHYAHLLGLASIRCTLERFELRVHIQDVNKGINNSIKDAQQSIMQAYHEATDSNRQDNLFKEVLLACALSKVDQRGYFTAGDVRKPMSQIMGKSYDIPNYARHLGEFCESKRSSVLQKIGKSRNLRYRFSNPLLQPYVIMTSLSNDLIKEDLLDSLVAK